MNAHELLAELDRRGVRYRLDGGDLKVKGPVPADMAEELHALRQEIVAALSVPGIEDGGDRLVRWMVANKVMFVIEGDSLRWECPPSLATIMESWTELHGRAAVAAMFRERVRRATAERERRERATHARAS